MHTAGHRALALLVLIPLMAFGPTPDAGAQEPQDTRILIGMLDLEANNIDAAEARAIADRIRYHLGNLPEFRVLERNRMEDILSEMGFQLSGSCDTQECVIQVGRILGVEKMVAGSVSKIGEIYALQVRLVDIQTSTIERQAISDVRGIELVLLEGTLEVAQRLAGRDLDAAFAPGQPVSRPTDPSAADQQAEEPVVEEAGQPSVPGGLGSGYALGLWNAAIQEEGHSGIGMARVLEEGWWWYSGYFIGLAWGADGGGGSTEIALQLNPFRSRSFRLYVGLGSTRIPRNDVLIGETTEQYGAMTVGGVFQLGRFMLKFGSMPGPEGGGSVGFLYDFSRTHR